MRPRFQADADFNQKIIAGLRRREPSIDFQGEGPGDIIGKTDPEVLAQAATQKRIPVYHDRQTKRLLPTLLATVAKDVRLDCEGLFQCQHEM